MVYLESPVALSLLPSDSSREKPEELLTDLLPKSSTDLVEQASPL